MITGATGFIGGWLARRLLKENFDVVALTRGVNRPDVDGIGAGRLHCIHVSPSELSKQLNAISGVDVVFHLATEYGRGNVPAVKVARTNLLFSIELVEWAVAHNVRGFMAFDTSFPVEYPYLRPYTLSKKQFAEWGNVLCGGSACRFINLVLQHPFGPGDRAGKFVPWIIERCLTVSESINLTSGVQEKDFIFVTDVVDACVHVMRHLGDLPAKVNQLEVGRGETLSVRRFIEAVHKSCRSKATLNFGGVPQRKGEPQRSVADLAAMKSLGWAPQISVEAGIDLTVAAATAAAIHRHSSNK